MHRVFHSPRDPIIFDTGHQSYVHKILTGRQDQFPTLRQRHGLSGYPSQTESEHDWVENSHASTALSYADGIAKAIRLQRKGGTVVAFVGDGSLTGGMAWEALNNIADSDDLPLVIVVNDNGRSYTPTVGGLARHLTGYEPTRVTSKSWNWSSAASVERRWSGMPRTTSCTASRSGSKMFLLHKGCFPTWA